MVQEKKKRKYNYQTDTPFKKRSYDKKSKYNNNKKNTMPSMLINKSPSFIPDTYVTKLKLSVAGSLVSTSGTLTLTGLRGSDLVDPQGTGSSQQPVGFDQLKVLYKNFIVTGLRAKVKVCPRSIVGADLVLFPYVTFVSAFTTTDQAASQPRAKRAYGFLYEKLELDQYVATSTMMGVPSEKIISDDLYEGNATNAPASYFDWVLVFQPSDKSTTTTVDYVFEVEYYCRFFNRILQKDA